MKYLSLYVENNTIIVKSKNLQIKECQQILSTILPQILSKDNSKLFEISIKLKEVKSSKINNQEYSQKISPKYSIKGVFIKAIDYFNGKNTDKLSFIKMINFLKNQNSKYFKYLAYIIILLLRAYFDK